MHLGLLRASCRMHTRRYTLKTYRYFPDCIQDISTSYLSFNVSDYALFNNAYLCSFRDYCCDGKTVMNIKKKWYYYLDLNGKDLYGVQQLFRASKFVYLYMVVANYRC
jgi:hypothetical protein